MWSPLQLGFVFPKKYPVLRKLREASFNRPYFSETIWNLPQQKISFLTYLFSQEPRVPCDIFCCCFVCLFCFVFRNHLQFPLRKCVFWVSFPILRVEQIVSLRSHISHLRYFLLLRHCMRSSLQSVVPQTHLSTGFYFQKSHEVFLSQIWTFRHRVKSLATDLVSLSL